MKFIRIGVLILFFIGISLYGISDFQKKKSIDPTRPVITSNIDTLEISCSYAEEDLFTGLYAEDERDGDLTEKILLGDLSRFQEPGKCEATYVVFDSSNQAATLTREVIFTDYHSPQFTLSQPLVFTKGIAGNAIQYVGAMDALDGDISSLIRMVDHNISYMVAGDYELKLEVTNSFGDLVEITLPVHVVDPSERRLTISLTESIAYLESGADFDPEYYIESVTQSNGKSLNTDLITYTSNVDTSVSGCYEVKYTAVTENGETGVTWLTVIVK